jgi:hypothetical protein
MFPIATKKEFGTDINPIVGWIWGATYFAYLTKHESGSRDEYVEFFNLNIVSLKNRLVLLFKNWLNFADISETAIFCEKN